MPKPTLKQQTVRGLMWKLGETLGQQSITFVIGIVMARLVLPDQFGLVAMLEIFFCVSAALIDAGFNTALIRLNDRTKTDCSTVFYFNVAVSILCYGILYICAPAISEFYGVELLTPVLRVSALCLVINAFRAVQISLLQAEMKFGLIAKCSLCAQIIAGIVGIVCALHGWQVWALVAQNILMALMMTVLIWISAHWLPAVVFSFKSLKSLFSFGSKMMASALLNEAYDHSYQLIIGKFFNTSLLAYFTRARSFGTITSVTPSTVIQQVTYPALCKIQDDTTQLVDATRRILRLTTFLVFPLALTVGAVASPLVKVLLTDTWLPAAPLISILMFGTMFYPVHSINLNMLIVTGRSDLFFKVEVLKKIVGFTLLCVCIAFGVEAICFGLIVSSLIALLINTYYSQKLFGYGLRSQLKDMRFSLIASVCIFIAGYWITAILGNDITSLFCGLGACIAIYLGAALFFGKGNINDLRLILSNFNKTAI